MCLAAPVLLHAQSRPVDAPAPARADSSRAAPAAAAAGDSTGPQTRLAPVSVTGFAGADAPTEGYTVHSSTGATKTDTPLIDTPQTVNVITRDQLDDQGSRSLNDALRYTPGAFTGLAGASQRSDVVALRGFHGGDVDNTFLDGMRLQTDPGSYSAIQIDPFFLERVDVVKGPSSALYGRSMPGGLVSLTTKKPLAERQTHLQFYGGSFDSFGGGFDTTGALPGKDWGNYRVIGTASTSDTQFDVAKRERYAIMPEVDLNLSDDTDLLLQAYIQHDPAGDFHGAVPYDLSVNDGRFGHTVDSSFADADPANDKFERTQRMFSYQLTHQVNDDVTLRSQARYTDMDVEMAQVYQTGFTGNGAELSRDYSGAEENMKALSTDNSIQYDFDTGAIEHTLLAGIDYQQRTNDVVNTGGVASTLDPFHPDYSGNALSGSTINVTTRDNRKVKQAGVYLQDQLSYDRLHVVLSGREDYIKQDYLSEISGKRDERSDHAFSGRAAVLYDTRWGVSPYFSYSEAFNPSPDATVDGAVPKPVDSNQYEIGLKYQPAGSDNLYTIALYDLTQKNVQQRNAVAPISYVSAGDIRSRGVELTARAAVTDKLHVIAGYSYNDIEYQDDDVFEKGNTPVLSPDQLASLWLEYDFPMHIRGGVGGRYVGESYANSANTRKVPDYGLMDAFVSFDLGQFARRLDGASLRVNANNLLDKEHVTGCFSEGYCYAGNERRITATLDYRF